jgi:hypothetical protein
VVSLLAGLGVPGGPGTLSIVAGPAYRRYDAIVQVGVGTALMLLRALCSAAVVTLVARRRLSPAWLALLLSAAICLFYLSYSPRGYLEDLEKHVIPAAAGGG